MGWEKGHEVLLALALSEALPFRAVIELVRSRTFEEMGRAGAIELARCLGLKDEALEAVKGACDKAAEILRTLPPGQVRAVAFNEHTYPALLKEIASPPALLFYRGTLSRSDERAVALVGSRKPSLAGVEIARKLAADLAAAGITVVSGLARGIDTAAHLGALEAGGRTIAVLGSGIDVIYPPENIGVAELIASRGAVVSELVPGAPPVRGNFPRRNRLISGLALGTVVVEAGIGSGALITADFALDQNRAVFAVPGTPGYARSRGTNGLIKQGAKLVETADDILEDLGAGLERFSALAGTEPLLGLLSEPTPDEARIIELLSDGPIHVDEISRHLGMEAGLVLGLLLSMETKGLARSLPGKFYVGGSVR